MAALDFIARGLHTDRLGSVGFFIDRSGISGKVSVNPEKRVSMTVAAIGEDVEVTSTDVDPWPTRGKHSVGDLARPQFK